MHFWRALRVRLLMSQSSDTASTVDQPFPVSTANCRACPDPCDQGHDEYPKRFDVDLTSELLGTVKPYRRIVIISTGRSDWPQDVTAVDASLAAHLSRAEKHLTTSPNPVSGAENEPNTIGLFRAGNSSRIVILNGSFFTVSDDAMLHTVLLLPDYKLVADVPPTSEGAECLWKCHVDRKVGRLGLGEQDCQKSLILPYSCVIQICSHKTRDNRCGIAAAKLKPAFIESLESSGWTVDTQLQDHYPKTDPYIDPKGGDSDFQERLKTLPALKRTLLLTSSHVGGHKFAGNCIIHFPNGSSVWYGRVTPHHVPAIVQHTVTEGKILPPLLRGGADVTRSPSCQSLYDW